MERTVSTRPMAVTTGPSYPVRKALQFTAEQWVKVNAFRFDQKIETEAETVRRLIDFGLAAAKAAQSQR
jgi:hypothetical protein